MVPADITTFNSEYQVFNAEQLSKDPQELQKRVDRYLYNVQQMTRLANGIPSLIMLQPEITGKQKSLTKDEQGILKSLGKEYSDRVTNAYKIAEQTLSNSSLKPKFVNFYQIFQDTNQQAFIDPIHLTEAANDLLAKKLYESTEQLFLVQPATNAPIGEVAPQPLAVPQPVTTPETPNQPPAPINIPEVPQPVKAQ